MTTIKNKAGNEVKIFAKTIEYEAFDQIKKMADFEAYQHSKIRVMPDCHAGKGCTIGTTMEITDKITPNLVGVDIGCGMLTVKLKDTDIDLEHLDRVINTQVPSGFNVHKHRQVRFNFDDLRCKNEMDLERASKSLGSLGGGNHFIEVGKNDNNELFLVIHSGSRYLGNQAAKYYQQLAWKNVNEMSSIKQQLIDRLKAEGKKNQIKSALKKLKKPKANKELAYLTGSDMDDYLHDIRIIQKYALVNRRTMADIILKHTGLSEDSSFETIHNYIDFNRMIMRKGAISAEKGEKVLIPINMRDGSLICIGKGNPDWNYSAPHGAGRLMSRRAARKGLDLKIFKKQMKSVYSTSVLKATLDEAPDAYKPMDEIVEMISETVDIVDVVKPVYNFKAH